MTTKRVTVTADQDNVMHCPHCGSTEFYIITSRSHGMVSNKDGKLTFDRRGDVDHHENRCMKCNEELEWPDDVTADWE
jgi:hypothetical protein